MTAINWWLLKPEIWLITSISIIILIDLFFSQYSRWLTYILCQIALLSTLYPVTQLITAETQTLFANSYVIDSISILLKIALLTMGIFVLIYSRKYAFEQEIERSEYFILMLFSILGAFILVSSLNFLTLYLGLELVTLPLLALIPIARKDPNAAEAAMKYFVMSAMASGMFLFGISLIYGVTKSFDIAVINSVLLSQGKAPGLLLLFAMMFIIVGVGFKLGAVPFHMWIPDVYQGSPTSITLFISTLPKLAGFGLAIRILMDVFPALSGYWQQIIMIMAVLSLAIGNLAAIVQSNFKRLLGYSTIANIGFVLLGLLAGPESGFAASLFYILTYAIMSLAAFGIIIALSKKGFDAENIADFKGLASQEPWLAFLMMLVMLSFTGIPPLVGFYAKFWILDALIKSGFVKLATFAVVVTVISAFYYLKIIRVMYFDKPQRNDLAVTMSGSEWAILSINCLAILLLGIFPAGLVNICSAVLR